MDSKQPDLQDNQPSGIPEQMMTHLQGLITTTINAAIMDYHSYQAERIEQTLERLVSEKLGAMQLDPGVWRPENGPQIEAAVQSGAETGDETTGAHERITFQCDRSLLKMLKCDAAGRGKSLDQMIDMALKRFYRR